jgi:hypothetical protein
VIYITPDGASIAGESIRTIRIYLPYLTSATDNRRLYRLRDELGASSKSSDAVAGREPRNGLATRGYYRFP